MPPFEIEIVGFEYSLDYRLSCTYIVGIVCGCVLRSLCPTRFFNTIIKTRDAVSVKICKTIGTDCTIGDETDVGNWSLDWFGAILHQGYILCSL